VVWIVFITTEAAGVSVSSRLSRLIAGKIGASDDHARADSSASSDYQENDAVRFNVALPKNILGILEARAVRQGHTIIWHIASVRPVMPALSRFMQHPAGAGRDRGGTGSRTCYSKY